jgi:PAS domain S-box-containing protein
MSPVEVAALAWSARPDGSAEFFSQHYLDYIGLSFDQARGDGWTRAVHPDDVRGLVAAWQRIVESGAPGETEARFRRHDGEYRLFLVRATPLRDETGAIVMWNGVNTDIDDRNQFRLLVDTIPALVWRGTAEGDLDYLNRRAIEYLGRSAESLFNGRWLEVIHPDHRDATVRRWMHSVSTGEAYDDVYRLRRADGVFRWTHSIGEPIRDADWRITRWCGVIVDVDDRKHTEEDLRRSEAFLAQAQRLTQTGSIWWDVATGQLIWSEETFQVLGVPRTATPNLELALSRGHPEDMVLARETIERATNEGLDVDVEHRLLLPDGSVKHIHVVLQKMAWETGQPQFVGAVTDITERKLAEEALNRARAELARVSRVMSFSTLTASLAHEVSQPLSGIITNAGTCVRMLDTAPPDVAGAREAAKRTIRDGNRAAGVITRLRDLFTRKEFVSEPLDLNAATQEVIALAISELHRNRVVLQSELADDLPPISGDRIQLQQVIINLLRNASDAMTAVHDRPRRMLIETRKDKDRVRLSVRDSGPGFDPAVVDQLFDAFYTTKDNGMGIGLSVSRSIIEAHHGRLWAELNEGHGATFAFAIPVRPS